MNTDLILTIIKLITKTGEKFELTWADKLLLIYFLFVFVFCGVDCFLLLFC